MENTLDANKDKDDIYFETLIVKKVIIEPRYLSTQIDEYILKMLKKKYEGKCIHEGYVQEESIQMIKKSAGILYGSHFTGEMTYNVLFKAQVCNPVCGNVIEFPISSHNAMCVSGTLGPMQIIVPKELHQDPEDLKSLNALKVGDTIKVSVIKSRYFPYGTEIRVIAKLLSKNPNVNANKNTFVTTLDDEEESGVPNQVLQGVNVEEDEEQEDEEDEETIELSDTESEGEVESEGEEAALTFKDPNQPDEEKEEEEEDYEENVSEKSGASDDEYED